MYNKTSWIVFCRMFESQLGDWVFTLSMFFPFTIHKQSNHLIVLNICSYFINNLRHTHTQASTPAHTHKACLNFIFRHFHHLMTKPSQCFYILQKVFVFDMCPFFFFYSVPSLGLSTLSLVTHSSSFLSLTEESCSIYA